MCISESWGYLWHSKCYSIFPLRSLKNVRGATEGKVQIFVILWVYRRQNRILKNGIPLWEKEWTKKNLWIFIFIWKEHKCCKSGNAAIDIGLSTWTWECPGLKQFNTQLRRLKSDHSSMGLNWHGDLSFMILRAPLPNVPQCLYGCKECPFKFPLIGL